MKAAEKPSNVRVLKLGKHEVEKAFLDLVAAHAEYVDVVRQSLESEEHTTYMEQQELRHYKALDVVGELLFELGEGEQTQENKEEERVKAESFILLQKKVVEKLVLEAEVPDLLQGLETVSGRKMGQESYVLVKAQVEEVGRKLERCVILVDELNGLEPAEAERRSTDLATFLTANKKLHSKLKINLMVNCPEQQASSPPAPQAPQQEASPRQQGLKLQPVSLPTFDGTARSYASFKKFWDDNMGGQSPTAQYAYLQQALSPEMKKNLSSVRKDVTEVWEQLERMFGDSEVVASAVMDDLWGLDSRKLGTRFMTTFCVMLEDTETLLSTMGQLEWLTSSVSVRQLEDKLPGAEQTRWAERMDSYAGRTRFEKFKLFLQERKTVEEKLKSIGTSHRGLKNSREETAKTGDWKSGEVCSFCSEKHSSEDCCKARRKHCLDNRLCFKCVKPMHGRTPCSEAAGTPGKGRQKADLKTAKANKKAGGDGGEQKTRYHEEFLASNSLRPADCLRCRYIGEQGKECAGCGEKANLEHCLAHCEAWIAGSVSEKVAYLKKAEACPVCLYPGHKAASCKHKDNPKYVCGVRGCKSHHHVSLHGSKDPEVVRVNAVFSDLQAVYEQVVDSNLSKEQVEERQKELKAAEQACQDKILDGDKVLMTLQNLPMKYGAAGLVRDIVAFYDDGSTCSIIVSKVAEECGLYGQPILINIGTVNSSAKYNTKLYTVELVDRRGRIHHIQALGLERISGPLPEVIFQDGLKMEFSQRVRQHWGELSSRPKGEIQLLVGSEVASKHPRFLESSRELVVKQSPFFGQELVLNGTHGDIDTKQVELSKDVKAIRLGHYARLNQLGISMTQERDFGTWEECGMTEKEFWEGEGMGCEPPRRCKSCRGCRECGFSGRQVSAREAWEYTKMEERVTFDPALGKFRVEYFFLDDPRKLPNNRAVVQKIAERLERKLEKEGRTEEANQIFDKMIEVGALEKMTAEQDQAWCGPRHYLPVQHVMNEASATTPIRLVTNSSFAGPDGISLNSLLPKGPAVLNDQWEILLRFRGYEKGFLSDIT